MTLKIVGYKAKLPQVIDKTWNFFDSTKKDPKTTVYTVANKNGDKNLLMKVGRNNFLDLITGSAWKFKGPGTSFFIVNGSYEDTRSVYAYKKVVAELTVQE